MLSIVTSYLLQERCCALTGIGEFKINTKSAETDIVHKRILPPVEEIVFIENEELKADPGLVKYVAKKRNEDEETARLVLDNYCEEWKTAISRGEIINLHSFGTLQKNAVGNIFFRKANPEIIFHNPVSANKVERENADHRMLVGDIETSTNRMSDFYAEPGVEVKKRSYWWVWAIAAAVIALVFLFLHFMDRDLSLKSTGNTKKIHVDSFYVESRSKQLK